MLQFSNNKLTTNLITCQILQSFSLINHTTSYVAYVATYLINIHYYILQGFEENH